MLYAIAKKLNRVNMQMSAVVVCRATTDTTITSATTDMQTNDLHHRNQTNINKDMATIVIIKMLHPPNPKKIDTKIVTMVQHHHLPQNHLKFHHHQNTTTLSN